MVSRSVVDAPFGEPAWDIATIYPPQGGWSEEEYLALPGNRLVEFSDGAVEVLPMPTYVHQLLVAFLYRALLAHLGQYPVGTVIFAPLRVRLWPGKYREPDLVFMLNEHAGRIHNQYWEGADLVIEVISPDDPKRDAEVKRREYAQAGIPEYWLVDPEQQLVTVFTLPNERQSYEVHGTFAREAVAESHLLEGFRMDVAQLFNETNRVPQA